MRSLCFTWFWPAAIILALIVASAAAATILRIVLLHMHPCAVRACFFFVIPAQSGAFFWVQVTADNAPTWLYVLDELPSLLTLGVLSVLTLTWCVSTALVALRLLFCAPDLMHIADIAHTVPSVTCSAALMLLLLLLLFCAPCNDTIQ